MMKNAFLTKGTALLMGAVFGIGLAIMPVAAEASSIKPNANETKIRPVHEAFSYKEKANLEKQRREAEQRERLEREKREREYKEKIEREKREKERKEYERKKREQERREHERSKYEKRHTYSEGDRNTAAVVGALAGYIVGKAGV